MAFDELNGLSQAGKTIYRNSTCIYQTTAEVAASYEAEQRISRGGLIPSLASGEGQGEYVGFDASMSAFKIISLDQK